MDELILKKLKTIPQIDRILNHPALGKYYVSTQRDVVAECARKAVESVREKILRGEKADTDIDSMAHETAKLLDTCDMHSLRRVINCTGVVLHTNLGRARLAEQAAKAAYDAAANYVNLEYSIDTGKRMNRESHLTKLIADILKTEDALVVNNNAAAVMLTLMSLCSGKEVILSRGEFVEIGGSFRLSDIMEMSGAAIKEVGSTNRTNISDYGNAVNENTGAIFKAHTSNYKITGFTEETDTGQLSKLAEEKKIPFIYDIGSGLLERLNDYGIAEPTVGQALAEGTDIVLFSGDKLMGGPQSGIIAGKKCYLDIIRNNPFLRVVRPDKITIAALESTLRLYRDYKEAMEKIPALKMISRNKDELRAETEYIAKKLENRNLKAKFSVDMENGMAGGGAAPEFMLDTAVLSIESFEMNPDMLSKALRNRETPIISRIHNNRVIIDLRTVESSEIKEIADALEEILS